MALSVAISQKFFSNNDLLLQLLLTYGGIIISFIGGVHWGFGIQQFRENRRVANFLLVEGVFPSLIAWSLPLLGDVYMHLLILTLLYALMWAVDSLLYEKNIIPQWFFTIRCIITPIVVVSLYVAYFGMV